MDIPLIFIYVLLLYLVPGATAWIQYPPNGLASMTHYEMPSDFVASCGCTGASSGYPTAAMSQMAFGSSTSYGPACGKCFNLTLLNTFLSDPPFYPSQSKSIIIKVTDLCPLSGNGWCDATEDKKNPYVSITLDLYQRHCRSIASIRAGHDLNFDLVWPSAAIPNDFFPSNQSLYGMNSFVMA